MIMKLSGEMFSCQRNFFKILIFLFFVLFVQQALYAQIGLADIKVFPPSTKYTYKVVASYPHDPESFTQGLAIDNGLMYESTGRYGFSRLRWIDMPTGRAIKELRLAREYFGEGITVFDDRIFQLTWKSNIVFVYDKKKFRLIKTFPFPFEGWGIAHDGSRLITSDGSATLRFLDPTSLTEQKRIEVRDSSGPVHKLNELEYVRGVIYANVWKSDRIAIIDPDDGWVKGWLDLSGLLGRYGADRVVNVLNGIAYDSAKDALYVTGKLWPRLFEIKLVPLHENKVVN